MKNLDLKKLSAISKELKILYVEDDSFIMESMKMLLKDLFAHVATAPDGIEALNILRVEHFNILLTDAIMPKMDGLELIKIVQKENIQIHIGVISAMDDELGAKFRNLGVTEIIEKPINPTMLFDALFRLCELALQKN